MDMRMKTNIRLILLASMVSLLSGANAHVSAQSLSSGPEEIPALRLSSTPVCENGNVNAQVKAALRLVCADRDSDEATAFAPGLIVIGFLGGFAKNGDTKHPEVWFGAYLRGRYSSAAEVSVVSNHAWRRATGDVLRLLDTDHNGVLTAEEKSQAKIIVYGHSWGASQAVIFAKRLERLGIPVLLTVQIDIVPKPGQRPIVIPPNVEAAVNFFQSEGDGLLHGRSEVVAEDPGRTEIIGNIHMTYEHQPVDCRNYPWFARTFNKPHHQIENDTRVWKQIASIIDARLSALSDPGDQVAMH
jgi:pimeloyl-ACP methyl ester carboxylesterase